MTYYDIPIQITLFGSAEESSHLYQLFAELYSKIEDVTTSLGETSLNVIECVISPFPSSDELIEMSDKDPYLIKLKGQKSGITTVERSLGLELLHNLCITRWNIIPDAYGLLNNLSIQQLNQLLEEIMTVQTLEEFEAEIHKLSSTI